MIWQNHVAKAEGDTSFGLCFYAENYKLALSNKLMFLNTF